MNIAVTDYASPGIYISQKNVNRKSADVNIKIKLENKKAQAKKIVVSTTIYERDGRVKAQQQFPVTVSPQEGKYMIRTLPSRIPIYGKVWKILIYIKL